jgi:hypothetical protein
MGEDDRPEAQQSSGVFQVYDRSASWRHLTTVPTGKMKVTNHEVGRAHWWLPSKDVVQSRNVRHLEGEIHLSPSLQPSCDLKHFQVEVRSLPFFPAELLTSMILCPFFDLVRC